MNTQNNSEILDFGEEAVTSVDAKLAVLAFSYKWADVVEEEEKFKSNGDAFVAQKRPDQTNLTNTTVEAAGFSTTELEKSKDDILDFGEEPVTSVDAKLAILAFSYNWSDMVEKEEKLKGNGDVSGPLDKTSALVMSTSVVAESSSTEVSSSKEETPNLCDSNEASVYKETADTNLCPIQRDSRPLQLGEKDNQDAAEVNSKCNAFPEKINEAFRIDNSLIQSMKRLVQIYDVKSGNAVGEIHAQYIPRESGQRDRHSSVTGCGTTSTCSTGNQTMKIQGLETIDTEISILSTEIIAHDIQDSKSEREAENEYVTKHPLMRLFLCGACCSKKGKKKTTEKVGLFRRIRKIFRRN